MIKLKHKPISETLGETGFNFDFEKGFTMLSDRRYRNGIFPQIHVLFKDFLFFS
jgi:hypothetical protein